MATCLEGKTPETMVSAVSAHRSEKGPYLASPCRVNLTILQGEDKESMKHIKGTDRITVENLETVNFIKVNRNGTFPLHNYNHSNGNACLKTKVEEM